VGHSKQSCRLNRKLGQRAHSSEPFCSSFIFHSFFPAKKEFFPPSDAQNIILDKKKGFDNIS